MTVINKGFEVNSVPNGISVAEFGRGGKPIKSFEIDPKFQPLAPGLERPFEAPDLYETVKGKTVHLFTNPKNYKQDLKEAESLEKSVQGFMTVAEVSQADGQEYSAFLADLDALIKYEKNEAPQAPTKGSQKVTAATARLAKEDYELRATGDSGVTLGTGADRLPTVDLLYASKIIERTPAKERNPDNNRTVTAMFPVGIMGHTADPNEASQVTYEVTESTIAGMKTTYYGPFPFKLKDALPGVDGQPAVEPKP